jgi:hypothetical protein
LTSAIAHRNLLASEEALRTSEEKGLRFGTVWSFFSPLPRDRGQSLQSFLASFPHALQDVCELEAKLEIPVPSSIPNQ